ncbi:hypothetical protein PV797_03345 [Clostridiaceae bacterium M8S5]|nr:hypothetical protein PV797_03345 [Clostridiaceae bacterium M8S5]
MKNKKCLSIVLVMLVFLLCTSVFARTYRVSDGFEIKGITVSADLEFNDKTRKVQAAIYSDGRVDEMYGYLNVYYYDENNNERRIKDSGLYKNTKGMSIRLTVPRGYKRIKGIYLNYRAKEGSSSKSEMLRLYPN